MRSLRCIVFGVCVLLISGMGGRGCLEDPELPEAAFVATPLEGYAPLHVDFADRSRPGSSLVAAWQWSFGDGKSISQRNPTHVYEKPGRYDVALTVSNSDGSNQIQRAHYITVHEPVLRLQRQLHNEEKTYAPGDIFEVTLRLEANQPLTLSALGMREELPPGWELVSQDTAGEADMSHYRRESNRLEMLWYTPPALPLTLSYTVRVPKSAFGPQQFAGEALFRADSEAMQSNTARTYLSPRS